MSNQASDLRVPFLLVSEELPEHLSKYCQALLHRLLRARKRRSQVVQTLQTQATVSSCHTNENP